MTLISLLLITLSVNLADNNLLDKLNNREREEIICRDGNMEDWGISNSSDYKIVFYKANKKFLSNNLYLEGKVQSTDSFQNTIPYMKIEVIKLEDDSCTVIQSTETNLNGEFEITFDNTNAEYLQFTEVGFTGKSIKL